MAYTFKIPNHKTRQNELRAKRTCRLKGLPGNLRRLKAQTNLILSPSRVSFACEILYGPASFISCYSVEKKEEKGNKILQKPKVYIPKDVGSAVKKMIQRAESRFEKRYSLGPLHHFMVASWVNPMGTSHTRIIRHSIPRGRTREPKFHGLSP